MQRIKQQFNTGRQYTNRGQIIVVSYAPATGEAFAKYDGGHYEHASIFNNIANRERTAGPAVCWFDSVSGKQVRTDGVDLSEA